MCKSEVCSGFDGARCGCNTAVVATLSALSIEEPPAADFLFYPEMSPTDGGSRDSEARGVGLVEAPRGPTDEGRSRAESEEDWGCWLGGPSADEA